MVGVFGGIHGGSLPVLLELEFYINLQAVKIVLGTLETIDLVEEQRPAEADRVTQHVLVLDHVPAGIGAATAEVRIVESADHGIGLDVLVGITDLLRTLLLGRTELLGKL